MLIHSIDELNDYAKTLAEKEIPVLLLIGDLGAGKTSFTKAYGKALGICGIKSPTFSIVEEHPYKGGTFYHMDLYRIEDEEELLALGFEEYFEKPGKIVIEWPEVGFELIPEEAYCLEIQEVEDKKRRLRFGTRKDFGI